MTIRMLGTAWCGDCRRAKAFLSDHGVAFEWVDIEDDPEAAAEVERHNGGRRVVPTIVFDDGAILVEPSNDDLARQVGLA